MWPPWIMKWKYALEGGEKVRKVYESNERTGRMRQELIMYLTLRLLLSALAALCGASCFYRLLIFARLNFLLNFHLCDAALNNKPYKRGAWGNLASRRWGKLFGAFLYKTFTFHIVCNQFFHRENCTFSANRFNHKLIKDLNVFVVKFYLQS